MAKRKNKKYKPTVLLILDGWGIARPSKGNAINLARKPNYDSLIKKYPNTKLKAHGAFVGLPNNQDGNSEAGHMNIGAGRKVSQDSLYINRAIYDGTFFKSTAFKEVLKHAEKYNTKVHLMGLLSNGNSAHSLPSHLYALLGLINQWGFKDVFLHIFTDGRDSPPFAAVELIHTLMGQFYGNEKIASIIGRFYAMDRVKKWSRVEKAYNAMVLGEGIVAKDPIRAITSAYRRGETDEFIIPTVIVNNKKEPIGTIDDNDAVIFFNLRSDRAREITKAFVVPDVKEIDSGEFKRKRFPKNIRFCAMTDFAPDLPHVFTAFPSRDLLDTLPIALKDYRQLYISETEKYAHVTYFFNGGYDDPVAGEDRIKIPSPDVSSYDKKPEMSVYEMTDELLKKIKNKKYDFITVNFANPDMIGHSGNLEATIEAVEHCDKCLGKIVKEVLEKEGTLIITADHGNAEELINLDTGEINTEHSANPVPFIMVDDKLKRKRLRKGNLGDIAPTILKIMELQKPKGMTGHSLLK